MSVFSRIAKRNIFTMGDLRDEHNAFLIYAKVVLDIVPDKLRHIIPPLWSEAYPIRPEWDDSPAAIAERGNILLFGNGPFDRELGEVTLGNGPFDPKEDKYKEGPSNTLFGHFNRKVGNLQAGQLVQIKSWRPNGDASTWKVVNVKSSKKGGGQTTFRLDLNEGAPLNIAVFDQRRQPFSMYVRSPAFYDRQMKGNPLRGDKQKTRLLEADVSKFDLTLILWLLLSSGHDGNSHGRCFGLLNANQKPQFRVLRELLAECRVKRNRWAHIAGARMPICEVQKSLKFFLDLVLHAQHVAHHEEWWPDDHLERNFVREYLQVVERHFDPNTERADYQQKMRELAAQHFAQGQHEFDEDAVDAVLAHWDKLSIYMENRSLRSEFFDLVKQKFDLEEETARVIESLTPRSHALNDVVLHTPQEPERSEEFKEQNESSGCNIL